MKRLVLVFIVLSAVAAAAWLFRAATPGAPDAPVAAPPPERADQLAAAAAAHEESDAPLPRAAVAASEADAAVLTVRGRCVDARTRAPVAGCRVELRATAEAPQEGAASWGDPPPQATDASGTFAFTVEVPQGWRLLLRIGSPHHLPAWPKWEQRSSGVVDLGDVLLSSGCTVRGRVVDEQGVPQGGVELALIPAAPEAPKVAHASTWTRADGTFELLSGPGAWSFGLRWRHVIAPEVLVLGAEQIEASCEVVVALDEPMRAVGGIVVDDDGAPVPGCRVRLRLGPTGTATTARDGAFRIEVPARKASGSVGLWFACDGYEELRTDPIHELGRTDLRFVLHRLAPLRVHVVEAATGAPIERYGVRCAPLVQNGGIGASDFALRDVGHHPGGAASVEGATTGGGALLLIEPSDRELDATRLVRLLPEDVAAGSVRVAVARLIVARVRVQSASGAPVAGTRVEALRPWSTGPVTLATIAMSAEVLARSVLPDAAVRVAAGETDTRGAVDLRVPEAEPLVLRVLGPGHTPIVHAPGALAAGNEVTVVVPVGATLIGDIGPVEVLAKLRGSGAAPGLVLLRRDGVPSRFPLERGARHPVSDDGSFSWTGIPPGRWDVHLELSRALGFAGLAQAGSEQLASVELREGVRSELHASIAALSPGTLVGRVQIDGTPAELARVQLVGHRTGRDGAEQSIGGRTLELDEQGAFTAEVAPGRYGLEVHVVKRGAAVDLRAGETIEVLPGAMVEARFTVTTAAARLRLVDAAGGAVAGAIVHALQRASGWSDAAATDAAGRTELGVLPTGRIELFVRHQDFASDTAYRSHLIDHVADPAAQQRALVALGVLDARAGATHELELIVPPEGIPSR